jgi:site-specific DNA-methyltransferase (adenine-specific)
MESKVTNEDCMALMARYPDKYFDLAVVDPPYGINFAKTHTGNGWIVRESKDWDKEIPNEQYFNELRRVSKNQIIWGGNYFANLLPNSQCWLIWDKVQRNFSLADGEMAWTSFDKSLKIFTYARGNESGFAPKLKGTERAGLNIHPTQKPIALYDWIFQNYAKPTDKILDTHLGSGSSRIAAHKNKLDFTACELDAEYFEAQERRFADYISQLRLF